jgi:hypothetical protein
MEKLEVYGQLEVQLEEIKRQRTKLNFGQNPKLNLKKSKTTSF